MAQRPLHGCPAGESNTLVAAGGLVMGHPSTRLRLGPPSLLPGLPSGLAGRLPAVPAGAHALPPGASGGAARIPGRSHHIETLENRTGRSARMQRNVRRAGNARYAFFRVRCGRASLTWHAATCAPRPPCWDLTKARLPGAVPGSTRTGGWQLLAPSGPSWPATGRADPLFGRGRTATKGRRGGHWIATKSFRLQPLGRRLEGVGGTAVPAVAARTTRAHAPGLTEGEGHGRGDVLSPPGG